MSAQDRSQRLQAFVEQVHHQLIVSCQALEHEPLFGADIMARMAMAAAAGGAKAIRANTPVDIQAIRAAVDLPIIGLYKDELVGYDVYITPTLDHARAVAKAGADIVAIDATARPHPRAVSLTLLRPFTAKPIVWSWLISLPWRKELPPKPPVSI